MRGSLPMRLFALRVMFALMLSLAGLAVAAPKAGTTDAAKDAAEDATKDVVTFASPAGYVGSQACASCHKAEHRAWSQSHHAKAMQHADANTVLGSFDGARHVYNGVATTFSRRNGRFFVNTDGPDGKLHDYEIKYTFGVHPLQQYLVELPGGRLQALGVAWDARPAAQGGQRWFHLYPGQKVDHRDELHWTRLSQNWNHMCAECHSTALRKNYSLGENRFRTTFSEISVGCEACHGPGGTHLDWVAGRAGKQVANKGLALALDERRGVSWQLRAGASTAARSRARESTREIDTCAQCHARRSTLTENRRPGSPIMDSHLLSVLSAPLFHADGQIRDEVFEHGSFVQSRMFHQGVTCSDCHEPHSGKLRAPGNAACLQCHKADKFDTATHHHHQPGGEGAQCASCHMPTTKFMVVHPRHDHSIRIPRPDLTRKLGTPNACNQCHAKRDADWADTTLQKWFGKDWSPGWHFGEVLHEARLGAPSAGQDLVAVALAPKVPDIARATAAGMLPAYLDPMVGAALPRMLSDRSPLVRREALSIVDQLPAERRWRLAGALLSDPVLAVRIEAARVLAVVPPNMMSAQNREVRDKAIAEYEQAALASAEHPQSHVNLGLLYQRLGDPVRAEDAYRQALRTGPRYAAAYVNLADLYRAMQQAGQVEKILLEGRKRIGANAAIEHALGLHYVRLRNMDAALTALGKAARLAPDDLRYGYVYAVALEGSGKRGDSIRLLEKLHERHPNDREVLVALVGYCKADGDRARAMRHAQALSRLDPRFGTPEQVLQRF